jgi:hypothetical protein
MVDIAAAAVPAVVTSILFTSIAFIAVVLRLYTRIVMLKNAGADDYIMVGAMVRLWILGEKNISTDIKHQSLRPLASASLFSSVSDVRKPRNYERNSNS